MGQSLDSMIQNQSKDELLYEPVHTGDVEAIKALCREGANLEWMNKDGKTPLIMACLDYGLFNVAKSLIEMRADINAYRPGLHAGTPLHHAAKRGLEQTVKLLLSAGANALVRNDDCQTALDVARMKGHTNVVRAIEVNLKETRFKFAPGGDGDGEQLRLLYDACRGIRQHYPQTVLPGFGHQTTAEAVGLATTMSGGGPIIPNTNQSFGTLDANGSSNSLPSDSQSGWGLASAVGPAHSVASSSGWVDEAPKEEYSGWGVQSHDDNFPTVGTSSQGTASVPSVPPLQALDEGPILYPSFDFGPVDLSVPSIDHGNSVATTDVNDGGGSTSCIICWEAPVEGACIPCGHMAGCMACLSDIKAKKGVCPVFRAKISQVIRLYAV